MSIKLDKYMPLYAYLSPASIPQIVAHIQDYLVKHPILSVETIAEIIVQSLQEHPELINGEAIPISADSAQSIKAYIDALPALDTYTKAEINALLLGKQDTLTFDQAPTPGSSNPVTSSGIIAAMSALQSALETQISAKADRASTYTKTQVDTLLEDKADADDVYTKNTMDAKLLEINTDIDNIEDDVSHQSQQIGTKANAIANAHQTTYGTDLNNYTETGMYGIQGATHYPAGDSANQYGTLTVNRYLSTDYVTQIWQTVLSNKAWIRIKNNGTWGAWSELVLHTRSTGSIAKASRITSGTLDTTVCEKSGNVVTVAGRIYDITNTSAAGSFFTVSEGFRPQSTVRIMGFMNIDAYAGYSAGSYPVIGSITPDGVVNFIYSDGAHVNQVGFCGTYGI